MTVYVEPEVKILPDYDTSFTQLEALFPYEENSDPEHRTHIINPPINRHVGLPGMSAQEIVDTARALGQEIEGLCGFRFIPKHNPEKFDACDTCITIAGALMRGNDE